MGFSRQEYWSGLPRPPPGDLPNPRIELGSPALQADSLLSEPPGKALNHKGSSLRRLSTKELFLTVVLEKALETPWDKKELKTVNLKGNQH